MMVCADDERIFEDAHKLYQQKMYQEALELYQKIEQKSPSVFYNMGNAAYHNGDYMFAHLYWLRAQKHGDANIFRASSKNLALLAKEGAIQEQSPLFLWLWSVIKVVPLLLWQLVFLIVWSYLFVMICKRSISKRSLVISSMSLLLVVPILLVGYDTAKREAMIINDALIYNGPHASLYQIGNLPKGKVVVVASIKENWINIIADGNVGWVSQEYVAHI